MFNFLVNIGGWAEPRGSMLVSRTFEHTTDDLVTKFANNNAPNFPELLKLPALFAQETTRENREFARVGYITHARISGRQIEMQFAIDPLIKPVSNSQIIEMGLELGISDYELQRTHWAVKEADLYRSLLRHTRPTRSSPRLFQVNDPEVTEDILVAVMMPFGASFDPVYQVMQEAAEGVGLRTRRADDIWENPAIIQDVVSLIDRARVVICDCSDRNPNVFYEAGIAHTLGREVVLIAQSELDVPFDLRHLRFIKYLNNGEGRNGLKDRLTRRLADLA